MCDSWIGKIAKILKYVFKFEVIWIRVPLLLLLFLTHQNNSKVNMEEKVYNSEGEAVISASKTSCKSNTIRNYEYWLRNE